MTREELKELERESREADEAFERRTEELNARMARHQKWNNRFYLMVGTLLIYALLMIGSILVGTLYHDDCAAACKAEGFPRGTAHSHAYIPFWDYECRCQEPQPQQPASKTIPLPD